MCGAYLSDCDNASQCGNEINASFTHIVKNNMFQHIYTPNYYNTFYNKGNDWYKDYNEKVAQASFTDAFSWNTIVNSTHVIMGFSMTGYKPLSTPTLSEFIANHDFVWETITGVEAPLDGGYNFLVASNTNTTNDHNWTSRNVTEAYWDIRWVHVFT